MGIVAAAVWAAGGVNLVTAAGVSGHWAVGDGEFTALEVTEASAAQQRAPRRVASSGPCAERGASDLYCLDLHGTPSVLEARGAVQLGRVPSPFGVTVTPAGNHVHELTAFIEGLPAVESLGPFTAYVAWAATPFFEPVVKLGEVGNGANALGRVHFNKFLILVTAEASADVAERVGRLVLRGRSPSLLMDPHDLMTMAPAAILGPMNRSGAGHEGHAGMEASEAGGWQMPPMHPLIPMLPGMVGLTPETMPLGPFDPSAGGAAAGAGGVAGDDLPEAVPGQVVALPDGGTLDLEAGFVRRTIDGQELVMMAFNGQHPGPMIRVAAGSTIFVNFTNRTIFPTAVHWHGVRLDNRFDGVPGVTQDPVLPGESFRYQIYFRDAGVYWYHPHHREDVQQELGLYGNMLVDSPRPDYFSDVNREQVLMLDDILLAAGGQTVPPGDILQVPSGPTVPSGDIPPGPDGGIVPFGDESANYMLMGRFGNRFLVNGEPSYELAVARGEVVRFFFTNASNTRTFNVSFQREAGPARSSRREYTDGRVMQAVPEAPLPIKVVGSDIGKFEREQMVESVVIAPAERYIVEVRFDDPGEVHLNNQVQAINHLLGTFFPEVDTLGVIRVAGVPVVEDHGPAFDLLRENADVIGDIDSYRDEFGRPVDLELLLTLEVSNLPLPVEQMMLYDWIYFNPVEWGDTMPMMNWQSTGNEIAWILREPATGADNDEIDWRFRVGDVVKVRLRNERDAFHAMQHPLHIHGQRFLVLEQDGVPNPNLVWKDTVLLAAGSSTDILLELSNPGRWMVHCHIAEHLESGMKFVFEVQPDAPQGGNDG